MVRPRRLPIVLGAGILAFYVVVYPLHGYRVSIGSDTPVYVWWARLAGAVGMGTLQTGSRPAITGLLATLSTVTGQQAAGVAGALPAVLAAALALAAAAFARLPRSVFLRAADTLHLVCAHEHGLPEVYTNDRQMTAAARHFRVKAMAVESRKPRP